MARMKSVTLTGRTCEPALVPALFDILRQVGRQHGLTDIGKASITIQLTLGGFEDRIDLKGLGKHMDDLWLPADVAEVKHG